MNFSGTCIPSVSSSKRLSVCDSVSVSVSVLCGCRCLLLCCLLLSLFLSVVIVLRICMCQPKQNCTRACTCTNVKWHGTGAGGNARVAKCQGWRRHVYRCTSTHSPLPLYPLSLSFPLAFPPSFPLLAIPRVPHPFSTLSVPCVLPPSRLATRMQEAWQQACKKPALGWLQSSKSPFKMHHPCLWRQLEPTVWGDNWSKQSGGKAMGSLSRILCHAFAEAQPLRCLCT